MYARRSQYQTKFRDLKDFFRLHNVGIYFYPSPADAFFAQDAG
jgi:hypothetical protein